MKRRKKSRVSIHANVGFRGLGRQRMKKADLCIVDCRGLTVSVARKKSGCFAEKRIFFGKLSAEGAGALHYKYMPAFWKIGDCLLIIIHHSIVLRTPTI